MGEIYPEYKKINNRDETINGVKIHRCKVIARKKNPLFRLFNYLSFPYYANKYIEKLDDNFDAILVYQLSPVLMGEPAIHYKKKFHKPVVLYCLDIWPESLKVGGVNEKSPLFKYFDRKSEKIYKNCDKILVTSKSFIKYFRNHFNIDEDRLGYLPQYAETLYSPSDCAKKEDKRIDLMFAGNIGKAQSIETIIEAANLLRNHKNLYWHIVGDGIELDSLKELSNKYKLKNVKFYGRIPAEKMPEYYKKADAMLVTLRGGTAISETLPGKVQGYMAAGKPIIGAINGDALEVINESKCGFCGKADDAKELAKNVTKFINCKNKAELSKNSLNYYKKNFDKTIFIKHICDEINNNTIKSDII